MISEIDKYIKYDNLIKNTEIQNIKLMDVFKNIV